MLVYFWKSWETLTLLKNLQWKILEKSKQQVSLVPNIIHHNILWRSLGCRVIIEFVYCTLILLWREHSAYRLVIKLCSAYLILQPWCIIIITICFNNRRLYCGIIIVSGVSTVKYSIVVVIRVYIIGQPYAYVLVLGWYRRVKSCVYTLNWWGSMYGSSFFLGWGGWEN